MTEQNRIERVAGLINTSSHEYNIKVAKQIDDFYQQECKECQNSQLESEKILNREAAYEEERLREEVKYWKDRNYELGGK